MSRKDDKEEKSFSDSAELFDTVFTEARSDEGIGEEEPAEPDDASFSDSVELFDTIFTGLRKREKEGFEAKKESPQEEKRPLDPPPAGTGPAKDGTPSKKDGPRAAPHPGRKHPIQGVPKEKKVLEKESPDAKRPVATGAVPVKGTRPAGGRPPGAPPSAPGGIRRTGPEAPKKVPPVQDKTRVSGEMGGPLRSKRIITGGVREAPVTAEAPAQDARETDLAHAFRHDKKADSREKPQKMLDPLRMTLFLVLLVVLVGAALHFSGTWDLRSLWGPAPTRQSTTAGTPPKVQERIRIGTAPKGAVPSPSQAHLEHPKKETPAQLQPERSKSAVPITRKDAGPVEPVKGDPGSVPQGPISPRKPIQVEVPAVPGPAPGAEKEGPKPGPDFSVGAVSHPYSLYLGSYGSLEKVNRAMALYRETGLSLYWVRLDLGNKGIWYRLFAGSFKTRSEADAFIRDKKVANAVSRNTRYALLTGAFTSREELEARMVRLTELGYSPYVITEEDVSRLYVGAFFKKERAERLQQDLSAKGMDNRVVTR